MKLKNVSWVNIMVGILSPYLKKVWSHYTAIHYKKWRNFVWHSENDYLIDSHSSPTNE